MSDKGKHVIRSLSKADGVNQVNSQQITTLLNLFTHAGLTKGDVEIVIDAPKSIKSRPLTLCAKLFKTMVRIQYMTHCMTIDLIDPIERDGDNTYPLSLLCIEDFVDSMRNDFEGIITQFREVQTSAKSKLAELYSDRKWLSPYFAERLCVPLLGHNFFLPGQEETIFERFIATPVGDMFTQFMILCWCTEPCGTYQERIQNLILGEINSGRDLDYRESEALLEHRKDIFKGLPTDVQKRIRDRHEAEDKRIHPYKYKQGDSN